MTNRSLQPVCARQAGGVQGREGSFAESHHITSRLLGKLKSPQLAAFNLFVRDKLEEFKAKGVKAPEPREGEKQARNPLFR